MKHEESEVKERTRSLPPPHLEHMEEGGRLATHQNGFKDQMMNHSFILELSTLIKSLFTM